MEILHNIICICIENYSLSSNDDHHQNSPETPQGKQVREQLESLHHVKQNFTRTPQFVQASHPSIYPFIIRPSILPSIHPPTNQPTQPASQANFPVTGKQ